MKHQSNFPTLSSIVIGTKDIRKAKEFYVKVFGISIEEEDKNYISARCIDGTHIEIEENSENRFPNWEKHNIGSYKNSEFNVIDIFSFLETVKLNGGKIVSEPKKRPWGSYGAEIQDVDGNIFLIVQK